MSRKPCRWTKGTETVKQNMGYLTAQIGFQIVVSGICIVQMWNLKSNSRNDLATFLKIWWMDGKIELSALTNTNYVGWSINTSM